MERNKKQSVRAEGSSSHRYKQIRAFKDRINTLRSALQDVVDDMKDPQMIKHYQDIIEDKVKHHRPFKKSSKFRGVSYFKSQDLWRSRLYVEGEEHTDYHSTELEAAQAYDRKVLKHFPERLHYMNFVPEGVEQDEISKPKSFTVPDKRRELAKQLSNAEIKAINPMGLSYFTKKDCDIALKYIEKKQNG